MNMKIAKASEMQQLDRIAIDQYGIPGIVLMENAGRGTVSAMVETFGPLIDSTVVIFVGPGNNGGDGLVIARHALAAGAHPLVIFTIAPEKLKGDAAVNASVVRKLQIPFLSLSDTFEPADIHQAITGAHARNPVSCIVDALFGTGLTREITGHMGRVVEMINELCSTYHLPVVAVDLPSGVNTDTGRPPGRSIVADLTVTYGLPKPAHYLHGGKG
ncbi:MAG TPA: NAD(P)H-hydrate epimerase, partial [Desulfobulbaceae bacterium]|nr:NAD(P)H-hydrate epimerase [Desulfobulbaceae bacterium]